MLDELSTTFYNEIGLIFYYIFRISIKPYIHKFYHPNILEEWKSNLDKKAYLKMKNGVGVPLLKKQINRNDSLTYFQSCIFSIIVNFFKGFVDTYSHP